MSRPAPFQEIGREVGRPQVVSFARHAEAFGHFPARRRRGFTLLEILVSVVLFAILTVLTWRGMTSVLAGRDQIVRLSEKLQSQMTLMGQVEEDLQRAWTVRLMGLSEPFISFSVGETADELTLLRATSRMDERGGLEQVVYRLKEHVVERGVRNWVPEKGDEADAVELPIVWQPVMDGIDSLRFRAWVLHQGWEVAENLSRERFLGLAAGRLSRESSPLLLSRVRPWMILGVEMTLASPRGKTTRFFSLQE